MRGPPSPCSDVPTTARPQSIDAARRARRGGVHRPHGRPGGRRGLPGEGFPLPLLHGDGRGHPRRRDRPPRHRPRLQHRQELPGPRHLGGQDQRQRGRPTRAEPEVLFDALHHAREHLTVEQALYLFHLLADGYGHDTQITNLVDTREIWIIFAVNPDGFEYDLTCTGSSHPPYCAWRKNRQPNAGSSAIGTDLNRNYAYDWGCCGGSSSIAVVDHVSRPEGALGARRRRPCTNFVLSRVVGGIQQIRAHITFHTNGQLILWPYGYTKTDIPPDMTVDDHRVFVAIGKAMAARNGYKAEQSSDLYITDGDQIDWMYGRQRIFSYTMRAVPAGDADGLGRPLPARREDRERRRPATGAR